MQGGRKLAVGEGLAPPAQDIVQILPAFGESAGEPNRRSNPPYHRLDKTRIYRGADNKNQNGGEFVPAVRIRLHIILIKVGTSRDVDPPLPYEGSDGVRGGGSPPAKAIFRFRRPSARSHLVTLRCRAGRLRPPLTVSRIQQAGACTRPCSSRTQHHPRRSPYRSHSVRR